MNRPGKSYDMLEFMSRNSVTSLCRCL